METKRAKAPKHRRPVRARARHPKNLPYPVEVLRATAKQRAFTGKALSQIAFPLGGIGTGTVSLGGRGNLRDWEIFNHPAKGKNLPMTFFAVWAKAAGAAPVAKILERRILPPYHAGHGYDRSALGGVARLDEAVFRGEYPFAWIDFQDRDLPVRASLEAFTPFIPLNADDSGYPVAVFHWTFRNPSRKPVELSLLSLMRNPIGFQDIGVKSEIPSLRNQYRRDEDGVLHGLWFTAPGVKTDDPNFMTAALATPWPDADIQTNLFKGGWWDSAHILWDDFAEDGRLTPNVLSEYGKERPAGASGAGAAGGDVAHAAPDFFDIAQAKGGVSSGALCLRARLAPGQSVTIPVMIAWHTPHLKAWDGGVIVRTYASNQFRDAWDAARRLQRDKARLEEKTRAWHRAFYSSSLPAIALDAAGSQASIIRTNTCIRLADGQFYGWEGCSDDAGCCFGTCTHVWNYEQALAHLFPALERTIRRNEFLNSTDARGHMTFRASMPANAHLGPYHACGDGQMGCIIRLYRDWQFSGDDGFLREAWPGARRALEYAWTEPNGWDPNKDGVMEGCQHNTYDIELYGPNPLMGAMYLGALEAAARMAEYLGEKDKAAEYRAIARRGRERMEKELWNGEYYIQKVEIMAGLEIPEKLRGPLDGAGAATPAAPECGPACECKQPLDGKAPALVPGKDFAVKYQHGEGCLADQLLGQWASHVAGIGYVLDPDRVRTAIASVFRNNFTKPIGAFSNVQRIYALNDEAGLLLCAWPHGNRPRLPFPYSDEVWTGIEYQVAAHLIYEGLVDEGLCLVKAVRDRHDGERRNPWNEFECGHHYARAMSSWSVYLALCGFRWSGVEKSLAFAPVLNADDFRCAFTTGEGWGAFHQKAGAGRQSAEIELLDGKLELRALRLRWAAGAAPESGLAAVARLGGQILEPCVHLQDDDITLIWPSPVPLHTGDRLQVRLKAR